MQNISYRLQVVAEKTLTEWFLQANRHMDIWTNNNKGKIVYPNFFNTGVFILEERKRH